MAGYEAPNFSSFHEHTKYTATHTDQFPLKEIQKSAEWFLPIGQMGRQDLDNTLAISLTLAQGLTCEGTLNSQFLPEEQKVWTTHLTP